MKLFIFGLLQCATLLSIAGCGVEPRPSPDALNRCRYSATLHGRLLSPGGTPVSNATITAKSEDEALSITCPCPAFANTTSNGEFTIPVTYLENPRGSCRPTAEAVFHVSLGVYTSGFSPIRTRPVVHPGNNVLSDITVSGEPSLEAPALVGCCARLAQQQATLIFSTDVRLLGPVTITGYCQMGGEQVSQVTREGLMDDSSMQAQRTPLVRFAGSPISCLPTTAGPYCGSINVTVHSARDLRGIVVRDQTVGCGLSAE